jgi:hypothetical protein
MSDEQQNAEPEMDEWEKAEQAKQELALRKATRIQADETAKYAAEKREKQLASMSQSEWRSYISEKYGYDPG